MNIKQGAVLVSKAELSFFEEDSLMKSAIPIGTRAIIVQSSKISNIVFAITDSAEKMVEVSLPSELIPEYFDFATNLVPEPITKDIELKIGFSEVDSELQFQGYALFAKDTRITDLERNSEGDNIFSNTANPRAKYFLDEIINSLNNELSKQGIEILTNYQVCLALPNYLFFEFHKGFMPFSEFYQMTSKRHQINPKINYN